MAPSERSRDRRRQREPRHRPGWSGATQSPSAGPWGLGHVKPPAPVVKSGRPAVLRAGLKSGHRGWKNLADISPQEWGALRPSKRMFLVCRGGPPDKAWFPWQSAFTPGLQGQALASAGMGTAGGREPITAWKECQRVQPSQGGCSGPGPGTPSAHPPGGGHLRAEAQPRPSQPLPSALLAPSLLVSGLFSQAPCSRWPWPLADRSDGCLVSKVRAKQLTSGMCSEHLLASQRWPYFKMALGQWGLDLK